MSQLLILSRGIKKIEYGPEFTPEFENWVFSSRSKFNAVAGWGHKETAKKARSLATKQKIPYIALEDGFLRSVRLGKDGEQPLSLVVDPVGIYYDARQPSQLEQWLEEGRWTNDTLLKRARLVRNRLTEERLSKYNHAPDTPPWKDISQERVLVIDQTFNDISVKGALATEQSFQDMLDAAVDENPHAEIIVKTHPDVLAGHNKGFISKSPKNSRIRFLTSNTHPWAVLDGVAKVYTVSSLMGFEALIAGKQVRCFGVPFYAGWGVTDDEISCSRRTRKCSLDEIFASAYLKYARYVDPINGTLCDIERIITLLSDRRRHWQQTQGSIICSGASLWRRSFLPNFLGHNKKKLFFIKKPQTAISACEKKNSKWALWASAETAELRKLAEKKNIQMLRIEDAFLRSVGLGSDLRPPCSLVIDDKGIYYDASRPSRLETILKESQFSDAILQRAERLLHNITSAGITKYNFGVSEQPVFDNKKKPLVLVPGQVEDDASILRGSPKVKTNLDLLRAVRKERPESFIIYKPHPDVLVGNRRGGVPQQEAMKWCDAIVTNTSMDYLLTQTREVHTMTSLTGFEALMRGCNVYTYGLPFYAGWGLTKDRLISPRRGRNLNLLELIAGVLILYPTYVDPVSGQICSAEDVSKWLSDNMDCKTSPNLTTRIVRIIQRIRQGESPKGA